MPRFTGAHSSVCDSRRYVCIQGDMGLKTPPPLPNLEGGGQGGEPRLAALHREVEAERRPALLGSEATEDKGASVISQISVSVVDHAMKSKPSGAQRSWRRPQGIQEHPS